MVIDRSRVVPIALCIIIAFCGTFIFLIFWVMKVTVGIRIASQTELSQFDMSEHGGYSYGLPMGETLQSSKQIVELGGVVLINSTLQPRPAEIVDEVEHGNRNRSTGDATEGL